MWVRYKERKIRERSSRKLFAGAKDFPKDQQYMVQAWIVRHEKELYANWELLHGENATFFKIEG